MTKLEQEVREVLDAVPEFQSPTASLIDHIIAYENGELSSEEALRLYAGLIESGMVWSLQGSYQRTAEYLIANGVIRCSGGNGQPLVCKVADEGGI